MSSEQLNPAEFANWGETEKQKQEWQKYMFEGCDPKIAQLAYKLEQVYNEEKYDEGQAKIALAFYASQAPEVYNLAKAAAERQPGPGLERRMIIHIRGYHATMKQLDE